jgi:hypothetical protein
MPNIFGVVLDLESVEGSIGIFRAYDEVLRIRM